MKLILLFTFFLITCLNPFSILAVHPFSQKQLITLPNTDDPMKIPAEFFNLGSESSSYFLVPDSSSLRTFLSMEYNDAKEFLKIYQISQTKSTLISKNKEELIFGELDLAARTLERKAAFPVSKNEIIKFVAFRNSKIYVYSEVYGDYTIFEREFDATRHTHLRTRILLSAESPSTDFTDLIPDDKSKIVPPTPDIFLPDRNYPLACNFSFSNDSSKIYIFIDIFTDANYGRLLIKEHVLDKEVFYSYTIPARYIADSRFINYATYNTYTVNNILYVSSSMTDDKYRYKSSWLCIMNEGKNDIIEYSLKSLISSFPAPDELSVWSAYTALVKGNDTIELLYSINNDDQETIGLAHSVINTKEKKVVSMRACNLDETFRKKFGIEDEIIGHIIPTSSYNADGNLMVCIEDIALKVSNVGKNFTMFVLKGTKHKSYYTFCFDKDLTCRWAHINQKRNMLSENNDPSLQSAFSCANYKKGVVSLTTFEEEPVKGLWVTDLDAGTGKIIKKTMPIEFIDDIVLPTNCLQNYNGKYSITQEIEKLNRIHVFEKK